MTINQLWKSTLAEILRFKVTKGTHTLKRWYCISMDHRSTGKKRLPFSSKVRKEIVLYH